MVRIVDYISGCVSVSVRLVCGYVFVCVCMSGCMSGFVCVCVTYGMYVCTN